MRKLLLVAAMAPLLFACDQAAERVRASTPSVRAQPQQTAEARSAELQRAAEAEAQAATSECRASLESKIAEYKRRVAAKEYWAASGSIRRCAQLLGDSKLKVMVADGETKGLVQTITNTKAPDGERLRAFDMLVRDYPDAAKPHAKWREIFAKEATRRQEEERFANRFNRQVRIGETQQQVVREGWGYPSHVNRTTTAAGVREQWVYGDGRYLYFENNRLTAIQD